MQYRRFGKTEIQIPVISCGGMRYQQSWKDDDPVSGESQNNLEACIHRAVELGVNHIETARGYGTSEYQLGKVLPRLKRDKIIVQTKVAPADDVAKFTANFEKSMSFLKLGHVDLFAFHGVNTDADLEATKKCYDTALRWKKEGRIRHIGFSTHGPTDVLTKAVETDLFEYINLHWYYIFQDHWSVVEAATARDMGVFIISPNDKGGLLYKPSEKLRELCAPLDPMVFNGLFCLSHPQVHTLSCGVSRPEDFTVHMDTVAKLDHAKDEIAPVIARLEAAMIETHGAAWMDTWRQGLPTWEHTPGEINIPVIMGLRNLALAFDMVDYAKMRYNLLGSGGSWFPGKMAENAEEHDFSACLKESPNAGKIPGYLAEAHELLKGEKKERLQAESA